MCELNVHVCTRNCQLPKGIHTLFWITQVLTKKTLFLLCLLCRLMSCQRQLISRASKQALSGYQAFFTHSTKTMHSLLAQVIIQRLQVEVEISFHLHCSYIVKHIPTKQTWRLDLPLSLHSKHILKQDWNTSQTVSLLSNRPAGDDNRVLKTYGTNQQE